MMTAEQKAARVKRAKQHARYDRLISGTYVEGNKGCSVGCDAIDILGAKNCDSGLNLHEAVANFDGTPEWLERLRDTVFENLPADKRNWWHVALAESLPVNVEWQPVYHTLSVAFLEFVLTNKSTWRAPYKAQVVAAIEQTIAYHKSPNEAARLAAVSAARSAAVSAVSAARLAAESAARSAESTVSAARLVAVSAVSAESAARSAESAEPVAEWAVSAAEWAAEWVKLAEITIATMKAAAK